MADIGALSVFQPGKGELWYQYISFIRLDVGAFWFMVFPIYDGFTWM
jgi:hypothetical protein